MALSSLKICYWTDGSPCGTLRRSPGFTATAILALALGIGANTAIFTVINTVLLQPLSYPHSERIVELMSRFPNGEGGSVSIPKFIVWREQNDVFEASAVYDFARPGINITGGDRPEQIKGIRASSGYFAVFGAPEAMGRTYTKERRPPLGPKVAVIQPTDPTDDVINITADLVLPNPDY